MSMSLGNGGLGSRYGPPGANMAALCDGTPSSSPKRADDDMAGRSFCDRRMPLFRRTEDGVLKGRCGVSPAGAGVDVAEGPGAVGGPMAAGASAVELPALLGGSFGFSILSAI